MKLFIMCDDANYADGGELGGVSGSVLPESGRLLIKLITGVGRFCNLLRIISARIVSLSSGDSFRSARC